MATWKILCICPHGISPLQGGGYSQGRYVDADMYNQQFNQNRDTELINLANESHPVRVKSRPFDWFICSVLGYLCFPCTGICAMYYAVRANHTVDWERDPELARDHTKKAKCLSLTSIIIGTLLIIIMIIIIVVSFRNMENASRYDIRYKYNPN